MTRSRSAENPFPVEAVATTSIRGVPDYRETSAFGQAWSILENFVEDFPSTQTRTHVTLGLRGAYGSGKTHLLLQLLDSFTNGQPFYQLSPPDTASGRTLAFYVKVSEVQLLDLYVNQLMRHLELEDFRTVISGQLAKVLRARRRVHEAESRDGQSLVEIVSQEVDEHLEVNPQLVLSLLESDLLPVTGLKQEVEADVRGSGADFGETFTRAYAHLTDQALGPIALKWLKGQRLAPGEMKDLGLSVAAIESPEHARTALRLLLTMLAKADVRFMLCLDELERAALTGGDSSRQAAAFVKDVAEIVIDAKQCVVFCGVDDAWNAMTPDVFDRIRDVVSVRMTPEEMTAILDVHFASVSLRRETLFDGDVLQLLAEVAGRSPRRLLTMAHYTFARMQLNGRSSATVADVSAAVERTLEVPRRRGAVFEIVNTVARQRGWSVEAESHSEVPRWDLMLSKGNQQVAVYVLNSAFKLEELGEARAVAMSVDRQGSGPRVSTVVVVTGYSTREVRHELGQFVERVFLYEEGAFGDALANFLDRDLQARTEAPRAAAAAPDVAYARLEQRFAEIERSRKSEVDRLGELLTSLQSQMRQSRVEVRDTRAGDKIDATISALRGLLDREQALVDAGQAEFPRVQPILEDQHGLVRRLLVLNEQLPEGELFQRGVERLQRAVQDARPQTIAERRGMLVDLESLHFARRDRNWIDAMRRGTRWARRNWVAVIATVLTVFAVGTFWSDVSSLKRDVADLNSHLTALQRVVEGFRAGPLLTLDEMTTAKDTALGAVLALREIEDQSPWVLKAEPAVSAPLHRVISQGQELVDALGRQSESNYFDPRLSDGCRTVKRFMASIGGTQVLLRFHVNRPLLTMFLFITWTSHLLVVVLRRLRLRALKLAPPPSEASSS